MDANKPLLVVKVHVDLSYLSEFGKRLPLFLSCHLNPKFNQEVYIFIFDDTGSAV